MTNQKYLPAADLSRPNDQLLFLIAAVVGIGVFIVDALTPLDVAVAVLYVIVVLLVAHTGARIATLATASACIVLTLFGFVLSHQGDYTANAAARCAVSLLAIVSTACLAIRNQTHTRRLQEQIQLLNLTHDAVVMYKLNGLITFWNKGAEDLYGWTAEEATGQSIHELTATHFPVPLEDIRTELQYKSRWVGELQRRCKDGRVVTISSHAALVCDEKGRPRAMLATDNDITERKRMEAEVRRQQTELRATIDAIPGMVWSSAGDGRTVFFNRRWNEMGVSPGEGETDRWRSIVHPEDRPLMEQAWREAIASGSSFENESRVRRTDGTYRWMHIGAAPVRDESGQVLRWYGVNTDIEARKQAEESLRRSTTELAHVSRMTALGELAASIAHEVTQPIAAIMTCGDAALRWLRRPQPDIGEASESLTQMVRDAKRASDVIRQIRSMAQRREPSCTVLAINDLVLESIGLVRQELMERRIEVRRDFALSLPAIQGDRVQIQQVLINLVMNAVQAMADNVGRPRELWVSTAMFDPRHAHVRVRDSGPGISEENKSQIFDAFFTTKADGVGMGLSICRSIVEAHGGRIWIESPPGGGATVQFVLPVCEESTGVTINPDSVAPSPQSAPSSNPGLPL
jgi:PAS domain S-box-containing protein